MLIMFRAKNFLSFKDEMILDLRKSGLKEHPSHTFKEKEFELLKTITIYGANASGKSNLVCAFSAFIDTIIAQFFDENSNELSDENMMITAAAFNPFLLRNKKENQIEFEIVFINSNKLFQYGFIVEKEKKFNFKKEWLYIDDDEVFTRENEIVFGSKYKKIFAGFNKFREDRLFISTIDYFALHDEQREGISILKDYFKEKMDVHFELYIESSIKGLNFISPDLDELIKDKILLGKVTEYVKKIDVGISNFEVQEIELINRKTKETKKEKVLKSIHNIYNEDNAIIAKKAFDLDDESSGTRRFISFIHNIIKMMDKGGIYIIDELSSSLHPILTKFIVDLFQSEANKKNAQLIFTTHETTIMNRHQFRRDEIVIVDKNIRGESKIYSLADMKVRPDATYDQDYFKGKYGGIPIIDDIFCGEKFND